MSKMGSRLMTAILALLPGLVAEAAAAAEIKVLCSGAMRSVMQQLGSDFQKSSGHQLVIEYATAGRSEDERLRLIVSNLMVPAARVRAG